MEFQVGIKINGIFSGWKTFNDPLDAYKEIEEFIFDKTMLDLPESLENELLGHEV